MMLLAKQTKTEEPKPAGDTPAGPQNQAVGEATRLPLWTQSWHDSPHMGMLSPAVRATPPVPPPLQPKLVIGHQDDPYEREAESVAQRVMHMSALATTGASPASRMETLQRKCPCGGDAGPDGECEECKAKRLGLQRRLSTDEAPVATSNTNVAPAIVHQVLQTPGQPLNPNIRAFMEPRFGVDFGSVRVHTDSQAAESARAVHALAYTAGHNVVFAPGAYSPDTSSGRQLLAHELAHVLQQTSGKHPLAGSGSTRLQRQPASQPVPQPVSQPAPRPRGPNPALCMTGLCTALSRPSATCLANPSACASRFVTDAMTCLRAGAAASNATNAQEILQNTEQELREEVAEINRTQPVRTAADRRDYIDWLKSVCERKQRELGIEFRFNVVFETVPGQPPWAYYTSNWDEIEASLEAIPDEHLWDRATGPGIPRVITFRRERQHPSSTPGNQIGGETDTTTGVVRVFDAGIGSTAYSRSQGLNLPATYQTVRHEVGHLVEGLVPRAEVDRFFNDIIGWREYSWGWVSPYPSPYPNWAAERERLCRDAGYQNPRGACDHTRLSALLARITPTTPVIEGDRTYTRGTSFLVSYPTLNVPGGTAFEYARTSKGDYFAELYALATSVPEFLHDQLPPAQITWLKEHVFHTQDHYDRLIGPLGSQVAAVGSAANEAQVLRLQERARRQFTRQQLEQVARELESALQRLLIQQPGAGVQAKLEVGALNDPYEREAESVAERVMRIPDPATPSAPPTPGTETLHRKCACGGDAGPDGECEECKAKRLGLQRKAISVVDATGAGGGDAAPPIVHDVLRSPGQPLDATTRAFMEPRFGLDFSDVRVHTGTVAGESARAMNAVAYTVGTHLAFAPGGFAPATAGGRQLLAHELTHVVQQSREELRPSTLAQDPHRHSSEPPAAAHIDSRVVAQVKESSPLRVARQAVTPPDPLRDEDLNTLTDREFTVELLRVLDQYEPQVRLPAPRLLLRGDDVRVQEEVSIPGGPRRRRSLGMLEVRTGDYMQGRDRSIWPDELLQRDDYLSIEYTGINASSGKWLQFVWFDILGITPAGPFPFSGTINTTAGLGLPLTVDPATPSWTVDSDGSSPFYGPPDTSSLGFVSRRTRTLLDLPGGDSAIDQARSALNAPSPRARALSQVTWTAHFDTYLLLPARNGAYRPVHHILWSATTPFSRTTWGGAAAERVVYHVGQTEPVAEIPDNLLDVLGRLYPAHRRLVDPRRRSTSRRH